MVYSTVLQAVRAAATAPVGSRTAAPVGAGKDGLGRRTGVRRPADTAALAQKVLALVAALAAAPVHPIAVLHLQSRRAAVDHSAPCQPPSLPLFECLPLFE